MGTARIRAAHPAPFLSACLLRPMRGTVSEGTPPSTSSGQALSPPARGSHPLDPRLATDETQTRGYRGQSPLTGGVGGVPPPSPISKAEQRASDAPPQARRKGIPSCRERR